MTDNQPTSWITERIIYYEESITSQDELFEELLRKSSIAERLIIEGIWKWGALRVVSEFLFRYRIFVKSVKLTDDAEFGELFILLSHRIPRRAKGYREIEDDYTSNYYMNDCGGFSSFLYSNGRQIDLRLQNVCFLVAPDKSDRILDIGSGRGELSVNFLDN